MVRQTPRGSKYPGRPPLRGYLGYRGLLSEVLGPDLLLPPLRPPLQGLNRPGSASIVVPLFLEDPAYPDAGQYHPIIGGHTGLSVTNVEEISLI